MSKEDWIPIPEWHLKNKVSLDFGVKRLIFRMTTLKSKLESLKMDGIKASFLILSLKGYCYVNTSNIPYNHLFKSIKCHILVTESDQAIGLYCYKLNCLLKTTLVMYRYAECRLQGHVTAVADLGGAQGARPPPWAPKFFRFHAVFREIFGKIVCWRPPPPGEILDPPLNSYIDLL